MTGGPAVPPASHPHLRCIATQFRFIIFHFTPHSRSPRSLLLLPPQISNCPCSLDTACTNRRQNEGGLLLTLSSPGLPKGDGARSPLGREDSSTGFPETKLQVSLHTCVPFPNHATFRRNIYGAVTVSTFPTDLVSKENLPPRFQKKETPVVNEQGGVARCAGISGAGSAACGSQRSLHSGREWASRLIM